MSSLLFYRELNIPSTIEGLNECLVIVDEVGEKFGLDFDRKLSLQTVIVESVENAIIHGNKCLRDLKVRFYLAITHEEIIIEVEDQGEGFDLNSVPSPIESSNIRKESGRGIFFIKQLSNNCSTLGKGNIIRINMDR